MHLCLWHFDNDNGDNGDLPYNDNCNNDNRDDDDDDSDDDDAYNQQQQQHNV